MASDLIRCPGCGVKMDLSTFAVRPDQVICPRCGTRSIVPPLVPVQSSAPDMQAMGASGSASSDASEMTSSVPMTPSQMASMPPQTGDMPFQTASFQMGGMPFQATPSQMGATSGFAPSMPVQPANAPSMPESDGMATASVASRPASNAQFHQQWQGQCAPVSMPVVTQPVVGDSLSANAHADPFATSTFFQEPATAALEQAPAVLPIDSKGNAEPLAFAIIGLLSALLLFPPIGLALCIASLLMTAEERRRGLYNSRSGATKAVGVIGIIVNALLLLALLALFAMVAASPSMLLDWF